MDAAVHTGPKLETKTNCQIEVELSDLAEVLADSGWRYLTANIFESGPMPTP